MADTSVPPAQQEKICAEQVEQISLTETNTVSMETTKAAIDSLYHFRDHYFDDHGIEHAIHKISDVGKELDKVMTILDNMEDQATAQYLYLRGRALNVMPEYDVRAEEALTKAVKLDPHLSLAWIQLGETFWKHSDIEQARDCFLGALNDGPDKVALRNLSMVLRQCGKTSQERIKMTEESVEKAKEAIQLDVKDGISWFILGNAYLSLFFSTTQSDRIMKQCVSAYQQAERDLIANSSADMHHNRAIAYKFQEEYGLALKGFAHAVALDPLSEEFANMEKKLIGYLEHVQSMIMAKGKVRPKKLTSLTASFRDSDLGPYSGGSYTGPKGDAVTLKEVPIADLTADKNEEKLLFGKVLCTILTADPVPHTVILMDRQNQCCAVTIYNLSTDCGFNIGDSLAIPEPYVQDVDLQHKDHTYQFRSIRVSSPVVMVCNGRKMSKDVQAPAVLMTEAKSD